VPARSLGLAWLLVVRPAWSWELARLLVIVRSLGVWDSRSHLFDWLRWKSGTRAANSFGSSPAGSQGLAWPSVHLFSLLHKRTLARACFSLLLLAVSTDWINRRVVQLIPLFNLFMLIDIELISASSSVPSLPFRNFPTYFDCTIPLCKLRISWLLQAL
jgi:hypothetical protein